MTTSIVWPSTLKPRAFGVHKRARSVSGSSSLGGASQIAASDAGIWVIEAGEFPVATAERIKLWRALEGLLCGRTNAMLFPIFEFERRPNPTGTALVGFGDGASFGDDTFFSQPAYDAMVSENAALRATQIKIETGTGDDIEPGHFFSIGERLYSVASIVDYDSPIPTLTIWPPLREAVEAGMSVDFNKPVCKVKLASDEEMSLTLDITQAGFPSIRLIEDTSA